MYSVPKTALTLNHRWAFIRNSAAAIFAIFAFQSLAYADINKLSAELKPNFGQSLGKSSKSYVELAKKSSDSLLEDDDDEDDEDSLLKDDDEDEETDQKTSNDENVVKDADAEHQALFSETRFPAAATCATCHPKHYKEWSVSQHSYAQLSPIATFACVAITRLAPILGKIHMIQI